MLNPAHHDISDAYNGACYCHCNYKCKRPLSDHIDTSGIVDDLSQEHYPANDCKHECKCNVEPPFHLVFVLERLQGIHQYNPAGAFNCNRLGPCPCICKWHIVMHQPTISQQVSSRNDNTNCKEQL